MDSLLLRFVKYQVNWTSLFYLVELSRRMSTQIMTVSQKIHNKVGMHVENRLHAASRELDAHIERP